MTREDSNNDKAMIDNLSILCKSYSTGDFLDLFPLLAEDIELNSMWVLTPLKGKEKIIEYYLRKGEAVKKAGTFPECFIVQLIGGINTIRPDKLYVNDEHKMGSVGLWYQDGKYCMLMSQKLSEGKAEGIIDIKLDDENKIKEISICMPELFRFRLTDLYQ